MDVIKKSNHSDIEKIEGKIQRFPNEEPKEIAQKEIVEELYKCYNTFYNPSNMILFVIGDLDENEVMDVIKKANHSDIDKIEGKIQRFPNEEPKEIAQKEIVEKYQVSMPMFNIAYKDEDVNCLCLT